MTSLICALSTVHSPVMTPLIALVQADEEPPPEEGLPPERLSGLALVRALWFEGANTVGSATSALAYYDEAADLLVIVSADPSKIRQVSLGQVSSELAMAEAQKLGASFSVLDGQVLCTIAGITQAGETYGEAAMRTMLAVSRLESGAEAAGTAPPDAPPTEGRL